MQGLRTQPTPSPQMTCGFLIQLVFCIEIGVRDQSVTPFLSGASPPKKNPGSVPAPPALYQRGSEISHRYLLGLKSQDV